jgi:hypothetical protein
MDNRFTIRNSNASGLLPVYERIVETMSVPKEGVYILLDDGEYPTPSYSPRYSKAFYMNIRIGGIEEMSPEHILKIMEKSDCEHFIWISPSATNGDPFYAAWVLAHEVQHLIQDIRYPELAKVGTFLRRAYPAVRTDIELNQLDFPGELDCEIKAKEITTFLFGIESYENFVAKEGKMRGDITVKYYKKLNELEMTQSGYREQTLLLLCRWKAQFIEQQKILNQQSNRFDFDIMKLCGS